MADDIIGPTVQFFTEALGLHGDQWTTQTFIKGLMFGMGLVVRHPEYGQAFNMALEKEFEIPFPEGTVEELIKAIPMRETSIDV